METTERGEIIEALGGMRFLVRFKDKECHCYLAGKMRQHNIRVSVGDKVDVTMPATGNIGRIKRRL